MPTDKADLKARLALVRDHQTVRGMIPNAARAVIAETFGPEGADALMKPWFPKRPNDFFTYPVRDYLPMLYAAADALEPTRPPEETWRKVARTAVDAFFQAAMGKMLLSLVGKDPRRLLSSAPTAYATVLNFGQRKSEPLADREVRVRFSGDMLPAVLHAATLEAAVRVLGREAEVTTTVHALDDAEYRVRWS